MVELVGAIICIISPKLIETPDGDDSDADGIGGGDGGGGGISGEDSSEEEENCGGGGGGDDGGGFSDCSNCDDGDNAGSGVDIALYIIIEFFINS